MGATTNQEEAKMDATTVAIDLAKDILEVAAANRVGRVIERKRLTRRQFERFVDGLAAGTEVIMEACGTAHYWGRRCQARDLRVRLLPAQYVRPCTTGPQRGRHRPGQQDGPAHLGRLAPRGRVHRAGRQDDRRVGQQEYLPDEMLSEDS